MHQHLQQQQLQMHQQQQHMIPPQRMSSGQLPVTSTMHPSDSGDGVIMIEQVRTIYSFMDPPFHSKHPNTSYPKSSKTQNSPLSPLSPTTLITLRAVNL